MSTLFNMEGSGSITTLHFACACREVNGSARVPTERLPLPFDICHCNVCRHQSGLLAVSYATLPEGTTDIRFEGPVAEYRSSETVTRSFCSHCGANVLFQDFNEPRPDISTGIFDKTNGVVELRSHIFLPDTKDGGLSAWVSDVPAFEGYPNRSKRVQYSDSRGSTSALIGDTELKAYCHCKGVQFKISRPNRASKELSSPWPDLQKPYIFGPPENKDDVKWWLRANDAKYLAGTCVCSSCRLASGFDIQTWAFIPKANIFQSNGDPLSFDIGTLKQYKSSEGTFREFCSKCGATVFWHCDQRPDLIDVSVGLLDASDGARSETWLEWWTDRVSFEEEAHNRGLVSRLSAGLKRRANIDMPS